MEPSQPREKRKYTRRLFLVPIDYLTLDGTGRDLCHNISRSGLFLETGKFKKNFHVGQEILLNIPSENRIKLLRILAKIARIEPYGVGVKFKKILS